MIAKRTPVVHILHSVFSALRSAFCVSSVRRSSRSAFPVLRSAFCVPSSGLSLVEILIALFVFMIGILGVLSLFPVAMRSAGKAIGEVRANIMAQSAIAQFTADCRIPLESGSPQSTTTAETLVRPAGSTVDRTGYFVTIVDGIAKGQSRLIWRTNNETLEVCPDWSPVPVDTDAYIITRLGLPPFRSDEKVPATPSQTRDARSGFVREITAGNKFRAGFANSNNVDPQTWTTPMWYTAPLETGTVASPTGWKARGLDATGKSWTANDYRGKLVIITGPDDVKQLGQVRLITKNDASRLEVYPQWADIPIYDATNPTTFEIRENLGYYVLFTSGRAAGRVVPIVGHVVDTTGPPITLGDEIILPDDVDLNAFGVTQAKREDFDGSISYRLSRATSFMIIGSASYLGSAHPNMHPNALSAEPVLDYTLNAFGPTRMYDAPPPGPRPRSLGKPSEPQTGLDIYHAGAASTEYITSDYSAVCIFSDNGSGTATYPANLRWPVRVDVLVFMNFDRSRSLVDNQRAVGYMTGYIERP